MSMCYDHVIFGSNARDLIFQGVDLATKAVSVTYGPNGKNVLLRYGGMLKSTKDGASVIQRVASKDPYIQMGIDVIKEASIRMAKTVGDGSTSVAVLAHSIVKEFKDTEDPIKTTRLLKKEGARVIDQLEAKKTEITSKEDLLKVATISANNDAEIGEVIAEAFSKVGKDGIVCYKESENVSDSIEYSRGFRIENGYDSPHFINTPKNECVLENVIVYTSSSKLEETKALHDIAGKAYKEGKSLLVMAPEFDSAVTMFLVKNLYNPDGTPRLQSCMVINPCFGVMRDILMEDINILLGESKECEKVIITKDTTTFIGYTPNSVLIKPRINNIRELLHTAELPEQEVMFNKKRLANYTSGTATIYVGGYSKVEIQERCDRYEDAIMATQCAITGGVLPGGGTALNEIHNDVLNNVLKTPISLLNTDIKTSEDAFKNNIIEPFLVVKASLENAISVASTVLTTECVINNDL